MRDPWYLGYRGRGGGLETKSASAEEVKGKVYLEREKHWTEEPQEAITLGS